MQKQEAKKRIEKLKSLIDHYRYLYHVLDKQEISEAALDSLKKELFDLEKEYPEFITSDSPTQRVGGKPLDQFEKYEHKKIMISFDDAFSRQDMDNWEKRNFKLLEEREKESIDYYCELKLDGLAIELVYIDGILEIGATRGDGRFGENVTQNIKTIESIPLRISEDNFKKVKEQGFKIDFKELIVRGEAIITKKEFAKTNKERIKQELAPYSNPRNLAAGSIRQLDPKIAASRRLNADIYDVVSDIGQKTHKQEHDVLDVLGFKTNNKHNRLCKNLDEVFLFYEEWKKKRDALPYEIDGIVVSINNNDIFDKLGIVGKSPRGAIALKFPLIEAVTIVEDIKVQVGRTGAITPVAILKPVEVNGVIITRATLHNEKEIEKLDLKIGDTVVVGRAGDVVPEVVKVFPELRTGKEKRFKMPETCPSCNTKIIKKEKDVIWRCPNSNCFARKSKYFNHFIGRSAFNLEGLGPKIVEKLLDQGLVTDPSDLFDLKTGDIAPLERFGEKSAENIIQSIQKRKKLSFPRFIYALGIRNIGIKTALDLSHYFKSIEEIKRASLNDLKNIKDIGPIVAQSIFEWFKEEDNIKFIDKLKEKGIIYETKEKTGKLKGLKFVVTGTLISMSREIIKEKIEALGGEVLQTISKNIDYLIVGENPGFKYDKAKELNIKILKEKEFLKML